VNGRVRGRQLGVVGINETVNARGTVSAINLQFFSHRKCLDLIVILTGPWGLGRIKGKSKGYYQRMRVLIA